ncbi:MAG: HAD family hydrolase [Candidatus Thermoplasmatota archaeon]|nr:HAD family hydrolase [Euryarchaeota archaeon]MBU4031839.1 HAD family hydrolase [Candidatus Thermoplasmatota archaeon]MBU4070921.1 HAD family hydrolase [Candidatus Thermoplasmatota archaeon]MBU4144306.1 HAD family hydrolase [Candidatus Thermoplasmatota archaeon]MBU4592603.1 HAD family hydrolase [Candidatus Thermoplasmatota archaeon]
MQPKGIVIFDLDDLLIMNVHWYWAGWQMFKDVMVRSGFRKHEAELIDRLNFMDAEGVKKYGFKKERFGEAMGETYDYYCKLEGMEPDQETRHGIVDIGLSVYRHRPILFPRTGEVLAMLRDEGYELYCVTKGDEDVQMEKIRQCGIEHYFKEIFYVPLSKKQAIETLLGRNGHVPKSDIYFVGNSMKDDMRPAIELEINGLLIYEYTWHFDEAEFEGMERVVRLDALTELPDYLGQKNK